MGTQSDRRRVADLLKTEKEGWKRDRLIALKMGFSPDNSIEAIASTIGSGKATVQRWFDTYRVAGLEASLERNYTGGRPSKLDSEIEQVLLEGLRAGRWNTATQARKELERRFQRPFVYTTVLGWIKNCAGVMRVPRPAHEKRDPSKAEAFKRSLLAILKALPVDWSKPRIV